MLKSATFFCTVPLVRTFAASLSVTEVWGFGHHTIHSLQEYFDAGSVIFQLIN